MKLLVLVLLVIYNSAIFRTLDSWSDYERVTPYIWETDCFRAMRLGEKISKLSNIDYEELAAHMLKESFNLEGKKLSSLSLRFPVKNQEEFFHLADMYRMIFEDISCDMSFNSM